MLIIHFLRRLRVFHIFSFTLQFSSSLELEWVYLTLLFYIFYTIFFFSFSLTKNVARILSS